MQTTMKTNATEFFTGISPLKGVSAMNGTHLANGRSGRCHCCPYGYHIDLDFVRYCEMVNQVSKNDNPTLRHLKKLKRQRRRQTQSMEVLLGLEPGEERATTATTAAATTTTAAATAVNNSLHLFPRLQIIEDPQPNNKEKERTPPPPPPRRSRTPVGGGGAGGPPPDVISTSRKAVSDALAAMNERNRKGGEGAAVDRPPPPPPSSAPLHDANDALQEAVLDFEEMLETSRERIGGGGRGRGGGGGGGRANTLPSLDLLHHTPQPPPRLHHNEGKSGVSVSRSHSLPRQWLRRPLYPSRSSLSPTPSPTPSHAHSDTEDCRMAVVRALRQSVGGVGMGGAWGRPLSTPASPRHYSFDSYYQYFNTSTPPPPPTPASSVEDWPAVSRLRTSSTSSLPPPPVPPPPADVGHIQQGGTGRLADTLAALNAARGCFTPTYPEFDTLSMTSGMSGVSTTTLQSIRDQMATSLARLKELEEEVKQIPVLQVKVNVLKEEKKLLLDQVRGLARGEDRPPLLLPPSLEGDLTDLSEDELETRLVSLRSGPARRRRSESPLRVNLEEFKSYRRARRGSLSEGSEAESMAGDDYPLRITEPQDPQRRPAPPRRLGHEPAYSLPGTPLMGRRKSRDAATSCRVLTRDVGVTHVGARTRSVGLMASSEEEPCAECKERGHRSFQDKGVATEPQEDNRRRLSVKSVSTESIGPEEAEQEGAPSKNSFLAKLGRKSAIISRLSEPQLVPPALTFDNSTNTEPVVRRDQACGTSLSGARLYTPADLAQHMARAKEEWEAAERTRQQLARSSRPLTLDRGTQATLDLPTPPKTTFRPLMQSVGSQVQPRSVDVGVGVARITDDPCPRCSGLRTRSVACGSSVPPATPAPSTPPVRTRSVASGELALHDPCCPDRPAPPRRSVGCSLDRLTDRLCDHCDNLRVRSVGVGTPPPPPTPVPPPPVEKPKPPPMHSTHTQTRPPSTRTASVNTAPLPIKKEEAAPPSPAGTPEVERRAFGSSGVRVCDKCHEAITSVAKDIVGTSGSTSLPPLPPPASKIPRLVDITKVEPRLDPPRPDSRASEGSHPDSQPSSLASQPEVRPSMVPQRSGLTPPRTLKTEPTFAQTHTTSSTASKIITEAKVTAATATLPKIQVTRVNQTLPEPAVKERPTTTATATAATTTTTTSQDSTTQGKRAVYTRQDTYTKSSEGIVNLGFEDHKPTAQKHAASVGTSTQGSTLTTITESTKKSLTTDTTTTITSTTTAATKTHKQKTDTKEDNTSRKTSESEAVAAAVIQGKGSEASESSSNESESEDEGGSVVDGASLLSQLGGGSTYRSDSSIFTAASEASRKKAVPSREMKAALKVLNDSIGKPVRSGQQLTNALNIVQREWLKVSSQKDADPHAVEDYMDAFEDYSKNLLQKVVNLADVNGNTAMHYAVSHGNFDVVSVLLDSKVCNVNQQNKAGYTATMLVSLAQIRSQTHASVVQRLFQLGDLNIKASQHGQTALMLAVSHGRLDMVQMLVAAGAEINIQDDDGSTALMCAAEHGHLAIVKFLLAQPDTDPTLMDNDGSTALTIAVEAGHRDVGVLLYKHLNLSRGSSPYSSVRIKRSRTPNAFRSSVTPPPRSSAPSSPGRSRKSSNPASPGRSRKSSASLSNLIL